VKTLLLAAIRLYRLLLSPWLGRACRFMPTCSEYGLEAIERHGAIDGALLTAWRVARCNPLGGAGIDNVPPQGPLARARAGLGARWACACGAAHAAGPAAAAPSASHSASHSSSHPDLSV
jgi:hypothetical protein